MVPCRHNGATTAAAIAGGNSGHRGSGDGEALGAREGYTFGLELVPYRMKILQGPVAVAFVLFVAAVSFFKWVIVAFVLGLDKETILGKLVYGKVLEGDNVGDFETRDLFLPGLAAELLPPLFCTYAGYKVMSPHLLNTRARWIGLIVTAFVFFGISLAVSGFRIRAVEWFM